MKNHNYVDIKYFCAVLLIVTSIILAYIQVMDIQTIANGTLMYIAQAFLLAASIFGLEYYISKFTNFINGQTQQHSERNPKL